MGKVDEALLKRIADHQMLHGSFRRDLGSTEWQNGNCIVLFPLCPLYGACTL